MPYAGLEAPDRGGGSYSESMDTIVDIVEKEKTD